MARISNAQFLNRLVRFSWYWHTAKKGRAKRNKKKEQKAKPIARNVCIDWLNYKKNS